MPFVRRHRTYYKYQDWTQPINPEGITATSGWTNPANAFDGLADTYAACGTDTDYIEWDLGADVLLSGITATGQWGDSVARHCNLLIKSVNALGVETVLGKTTGSASTSTYTLTTTFSETAVNKLRFYLTTSDSGGNPTTTYKTRIREINLTANRQVFEGTSSDYDYYIDNNKFYNFVRNVRTYYKYDERVFEQPVLTANGTLGGNSFAVASNVSQYSGYDVFKLFNNNDTAYGFHSLQGTVTGYIDLYDPNPLKITNILVNNQNAAGAANRASTTGNIYGSNNGSDWELITSYTNTVQGINAQWNIDLSSNNKYYKYYRLESTACSSGGYWTIGELTLTAQEKVGVESSAEDSDYYIDSNKLYNLVKRYRNYYKYGERAFEQPTLNDNGTLGGDKFAVSSNVTQYNSSDCAVYMAFDNTANTQFHSTAGVKTGYIDLYNPNPLKITNIKITNQGAGNRASSAGIIYGSSDSEKWEQITTYTNTVQSSNGVWNIDLSSNTKYYNYYRIESTAGGSDSYWTIGEITLTAQEKGLYVKINVGGGDVFRDWKQPVLSSNGVMGGSKFAVNQSSVLSSVNSDGAWLVFDGVGSTTRWHSAQSLPAWLSWYNPNPLKITNVKVTNRSTDGSYPNAYQLQYSDDNLSWTTAVSGNGTSGDSVSWNILVAHDTAHKYWRLYITSASGGYSTYVAIGEIEITAQELKAVGGSVEDADGYIDTNKRY